MVWAIGDIQGCYKPLKELLKKIGFDPKKDKLWIAGDLVNRGKKSLETLQYLYDIRESIEVVLGNHDLALIAAYYGLKKGNPTIDPVLKAPNAGELIDWLRKQKFLHCDYELGYCMAHAGISPEFDLGMATHYAQKIEKRLQGDGFEGWLELMFQSGVDRLDINASETDIERYIISSFTRMRFCYDDGKLDFKQKGAPNPLVIEQKGLKPWFAVCSRKKIELKIIFGHWSTLGYYHDSEVCCLDTGCVWDGALTAMRLDGEREEVVQVECKGKEK
jgi:bis(5'-nucleosyl)-tetraphosphatase (symmetrical)